MDEESPLLPTWKKRPRPSAADLVFCIVLSSCCLFLQAGYIALQALLPSLGLGAAQQLLLIYVAPGLIDQAIELLWGYVVRFVETSIVSRLSSASLDEREADSLRKIDSLNSASMILFFKLPRRFCTTTISLWRAQYGSYSLGITLGLYVVVGLATLHSRPSIERNFDLRYERNRLLRYGRPR